MHSTLRYIARALLSTALLFCIAFNVRAQGGIDPQPEFNKQIDALAQKIAAKISNDAATIKSQVAIEKAIADQSTAGGFTAGGAAAKLAHDQVWALVGATWLAAQGVDLKSDPGKAVLATISAAAAVKPTAAVPTPPAPTPPVAPTPSSAPVIAAVKAANEVKVPVAAAENAPTTSVENDLKKWALDLYAKYAAANSGAKDTDDAFAQYLKTQGAETGGLHDLLVQLRSLQKASGVSPDSAALKEWFTSAATSGSSNQTAVTPPTTPATDSAAGMSAAEKDALDKLKIDERALNAKIKALPVKSTNPSDATAKALNDAIDLKLAELSDALHENADRQDVLIATVAQAKADAAVKAFKPKSDPATADDTKASTALAAAAAAAKAGQESASENLHLLQAKLAQKRTAPAAKQGEYTVLKGEEEKLNQTIKQDNTALADWTAKVTAANALIVKKDPPAAATDLAQAKKDLADAPGAQQKLQAEIADAQKRLPVNSAGQDVLSAAYVLESATAAKTIADAQKDPTNQIRAQAKFDKATKDLTDVTAGKTALSKGLDSGPAEAKAIFGTLQGFFHTGVTLINPYQITATAKVDATATAPAKPATLSVSPASGTDTNAFLEFVLENRWAWNADRMNYVVEPESPNRFRFGKIYQWDVEANLGYTFTSSSTTSPSTPASGNTTTTSTTGTTPPATNLAGTANTLVGSGNFAADLAVSKPLVFYRSKADDYAFTIGPAMAYGVVTDRSALKAHPRFFWGAAYTASLRDPFGSIDPNGKPRRILLNFRGGWAKIDSVRFKPDDPTATVPAFTTNNIYSINDNLPAFFHERAGAFETELLYPVKTSTFITFGSRVYTGVAPNPWSVQIGLSLSLGDAASSFTNGFLK